MHSPKPGATHKQRTSMNARPAMHSTSGLLAVPATSAQPGLDVISQPQGLAACLDPCHNVLHYVWNTIALAGSNTHIACRQTTAN